jgi:tetratricopeptide (TPR) repeat protein
MPYLAFAAVICLSLSASELLTVPHELAHALAGLLLGLRVFKVSIGWFGTTLYRRRLLGCTFELKSLPVGGYTVVAPRTLHWARLRCWLVILAGPLINVLLLVVGFSGMVSPRCSAIERFLWMLLFGGNLAGLLDTLWPRRTVGGVASDGLQLLSIPFASQATLEDRHVAYFLLEAAACTERKDPTSAQAWLQRGLDVYPGNPGLLVLLASVLLRDGATVQARDVFASVLNSPGLQPSLRALLLNNVAWADLCLDDPALLEEADRYSREAMEWLPWESYVKGTRACVLIELGEAAQGVTLLRTAGAQRSDLVGLALNACYLAIGLAKLGDLPSAEEALAEARRLDRGCILLDKATRRLQQKLTADTAAAPADDIAAHFP